MDLGVKDLRVLVTAGASGIGLEIARAFVREGAKVHICDIDTQALAAGALSDPVLTQSGCDVADRAQVANLFQVALKNLGGLDCLVNNAGIAGPPARSKRSIPRTGTAAWPSTSPASSIACGWRCRISSSPKTPAS